MNPANRQLKASPSAVRWKMAVKKTATRSLEFSDSIINTIREPLIVLDQDLRVVSVSRSFYGFFKVTPEETIGRLIYDLGNKQWDIPKLRKLLETILPQKSTFENYEVEHDFATIGKRITGQDTGQHDVIGNDGGGVDDGRGVWCAVSGRSGHDVGQHVKAVRDLAKDRIHKIERARRRLRHAP